MRIAVLVRREASGQYSHPKENTTGRGPVTGQCENIHFMTFLTFFSTLKVLKEVCVLSMTTHLLTID